MKKKTAHDMKLQMPQKQNKNQLKNIASSFKFYNFLKSCKFYLQGGGYLYKCLL